MDELIKLKQDEAVTTSLLVAEKFEKRHADVIKSIEKMIFNERNFALVKMFQKSRYKDAKGEYRPMYYINRDGFSLLVMGFTGQKAFDWKLKYIESFNKMESIIMERKTGDWVEGRRQGILTRRNETDMIQKLIDYAKEQGSKHSDKLYVVYTKLAKEMSGVSCRDEASVMALNNLTTMENIIYRTILNGMYEGLFYKTIYHNCKARLLAYKDIAYLDEPEPVLMIG